MRIPEGPEVPPATSGARQRRIARDYPEEAKWMVENESEMPAGWYPYPKTGNPYKDTEYRYWDGDMWLEPPKPPLWKYLVVTLWSGAMIVWYGFCILFIVLILYFTLKG